MLPNVGPVIIYALELLLEAQGVSTAAAALNHTAAAGHGISDRRAGFQTPPPRSPQQQQQQQPGLETTLNLISGPELFARPGQRLQRQQQQVLAEGSVPASFQFGSSSSQSFDGLAAPQVFNPFSGELHAAGPPWLAGSHLPMGAVQVARSAPLQQGTAAQVLAP